MSAAAVVVGVDGSSASRIALEWAANRAGHGRLLLRLVHLYTVSGEEEEDRLLESREWLAAAGAYLRRDHPELAWTSVSEPGDTAGLAARAMWNELLVIGTHKTGFVHGRVFGSLGLRLAATAGATIAVVPASTTAHSAGVVVGVDSSAVGDAAIRFAAREAQQSGQDLILVRAHGPVPTRRAVDEAAEMTFAGARIAEDAAPGVRVRTRAIDREPARALVEVAAMARMLVIGSSRRHRAGVPALGPVSFDVLVNLTSPTVVVHPAR